MAAANKARAKAKANGKEVKMHDDEDDLHEVKDEEGEMTGQPDRGKRKHSPEGGGVAGARDTKRHKNAYEISGFSAQVVGTKGKADGPEGKVASADVAAAVDADPPLDQLMRLVKDKEGQVQPEKGDSVVYWMRMEDMRGERALWSKERTNGVLIHYSGRQHCAATCERKSQRARCITRGTLRALSWGLQDPRS